MLIKRIVKTFSEQYKVKIFSLLYVKCHVDCAHYNFQGFEIRGCVYIKYFIEFTVKKDKTIQNFHKIYYLYL